MKASELKLKHVIRMSDGSVAGKIIDFEFNPLTYQIESVCVREKQTLFKEILQLFTKERVLVIDVKKIQQIGKDVIFAEVNSV